MPITAYVITPENLYPLDCRTHHLNNLHWNVVGNENTWHSRFLRLMSVILNRFFSSVFGFQFSIPLQMKYAATCSNLTVGRGFVRKEACSFRDSWKVIKFTGKNRVITVVSQTLPAYRCSNRTLVYY